VNWRIMTMVVAAAGALPAQPADSETAVAVPLNEQRIFKIIPDYQTVEDSSRAVAPLPASEKWRLAWKEVADPFNLASALAAAAMSQADNETPRYGHGAAAYGLRAGAAIADFSTQSFLAAGAFACLLHQDPRYFRKGPSSGIVPRALYSLSRLVIARQDSGRAAFNGSNFLGMAGGIGLSNLYYPRASRTGAVMLDRVGTSLTGGAMGNLMSEFWPDIQKKFFRKKRHDSF
jgi:hypothetical protein